MSQSFLFHYTGKWRLPEGQEAVFDDTYKRAAPLEILVGAQQTIEGLDLALLQMKEGEVAKVVVAPTYAFGQHGNPHGFHGSGDEIPGNATLEFHVELLHWRSAADKEVDFTFARQFLSDSEGKENKKSFSEVIDEVKKLKQFGNQLLSTDRGIYRAIYKYHLGLKMLQQITAENEEQRQQLKDLQIALWSNISLGHLRKHEWKFVKFATAKVLELDPDNPKALYRQAKAFNGEGEHIKAKENLLKAFQRVHSPEIQNELQLTNQLLDRQQYKEKKVYSEVFNKLREDGLYTDAEPGKPPKAKCRICGEEVDQIQLARHVIKKHSDKPSVKNDY
jgi:FK506-binding protein 4/5